MLCVSAQRTMLFSRTSVLNSSAVKWEPLPDTMVSGRPNGLNTVLRKASIVAHALVPFKGTTSIHLVCESITTNSIRPSSGPTKFICRLYQCRPITGHETEACLCSIDLGCIQIRHVFTRLSMYLQMRGYHSKEHARSFMEVLP